MSEFLFDQKIQIQMDVCCIGCILTSTNTQAAGPDKTRAQADSELEVETIIHRA